MYAYVFLYMIVYAMIYELCAVCKHFESRIRFAWNTMIEGSDEEPQLAIVPAAHAAPKRTRRRKARLLVGPWIIMLILVHGQLFYRILF